MLPSNHFTPNRHYKRRISNTNKYTTNEQTKPYIFIICIQSNNTNFYLYCYFPGSISSEKSKMLDITRDKPIKVAVRVAVPVRDHPKVQFSIKSCYLMCSHFYANQQKKVVCFSSILIYFRAFCRKKKYICVCLVCF